MSARAFEVRRAAEPERAEALAILREAGLPLVGLDGPGCELWVASAGGEVAGVAGLERHGRSGLLRSVATRPAWRGRGVAGALCERLLAEAAAGGAQRVYLLTEGAEGYFRRLGFVPESRAAADPAVLESAEFRSGHCASAVLMARSPA